MNIPGLEEVRSLRLKKKKNLLEFVSKPIPDEGGEGKVKKIKAPCPSPFPRGLC